MDIARTTASVSPVVSFGWAFVSEKCIRDSINVTPGLKAAVEEKIGKLERYFNQDTEVNITLTVEKDRQKIEVTIPVKGTIIRAEQESNDMYVSIDLVEEIIERQLKKYKNKICLLYTSRCV